MKIDNAKGWTELIIDEGCSNEKFYKVAGILNTNLNIVFTNKTTDLDSIYWDFIYKDTELTLHYNNYIGVSIFPKAFKNSVDIDNKTISELAQSPILTHL